MKKVINKFLYFVIGCFITQRLFSMIRRIINLKTIMAVTVIIASAHFSYEPIKQSIISFNINNIKRATFTLRTYKGSGSATAVLVKGKKYILTNSHVCLSDDHNKLFFDKNYINTINRSTYFFSLENDGNIINNYKVRGKNIKVNVKYDICMLPYNDSLQAVSFYDVKKKPFYYKYFLDKSESSVDRKIYHFTRNLFKEVNVIKGAITHFKFDMEMCENNMFKEKECGRIMKRLSQLVIDIKIVQGDSGSAVYNGHFELTNVVFGNSLRLEDYMAYTDNNKKRLNRKEFESFVNHGYITEDKQLKLMFALK